MFIAAVAHGYAFPYQQYQAAQDVNLMGISSQKSSVTKKQHGDEPSALVQIQISSNTISKLIIS